MNAFTSPDIISNVANLILVLGIPALVLFVGFYALKSPWRAEPVGRALMYFALSLTSILLFALIGVFLGDYPGKAVVRLLMFAALTVTSWRLFFILRFIQTGKHQPPAAPVSTDEVPGGVVVNIFAPGATGDGGPRSS